MRTNGNDSEWFDSCDRFTKLRDADLDEARTSEFLETAKRYVEACRKITDELG